MSPSINLDTHIADIVNVIKHEELSDVVLVGHSYGGMVVTGVADALADKIRSLVYLDAFVPESGQALVDLAPPELKPQPASDYTLVPLPAAVFGASPEVAAFVDARTSPAPGRLLRSAGQAHRLASSASRRNLHLRQRPRRPPSRRSTKSSRASRAGRYTPCPARTLSRSTCRMNRRLSCCRKCRRRRRRPEFMRAGSRFNQFENARRSAVPARAAACR